MTTYISTHIRQLFVVTLLFAFSSLYAANDPKEVITISTAKFGSELVGTWIKKYTETHPEVQIRLVNGSDDQADLAFISGTTATKEGEQVTYVGRYALLPVTTVENPLHEQLASQRFNEKELKRLFFQDDIFQKMEKGKQDDDLSKGLTVYSGTNRASGASAFASYFGYQPSQLRGKRVAGDDIYLLTAISKDKTGITFNNLTYIFDLQSRKLKPSLSLISLDLKKEQRNVLDGGNLDETLQLLEGDNIDLIPLEKVGFAYSNQSAVASFLQWIVSEGQQYNHTYGFLMLDSKSAGKAQKQLEEQLLTNR